MAQVLDLRADVQALATRLLEKRNVLATAEVEGDIVSAVNELLVQIEDCTACSGVYIWTVVGDLKTIRDLWQARMDHYQDTRKRNAKNKILLTLPEEGKDQRAVKFSLSPLNRNRMENHDAEENGSVTLYVGQRGDLSLTDRQKEHCGGHPETGAIKLGSSHLDETRLVSPEQQAFYEMFLEEDIRLLNQMGLERITCEVIQVPDASDDELRIYEAIVRHALQPIVGRR